jgi:glycosyltransferase involved in cell wall biosynthesis
MSRDIQPVLGMVLKGYPRISETFISNEIILLERMGVKIHIISMRQPREPFSHASVKQIRAAVDYLPETLLRGLPRLMAHNILLALSRPRIYARAAAMAARRFLRTRKAATIKHLLQAGVVVRKILPGSGVAHLHAHFAHSPTSVTLFTSLLSGLPFSFTAHAKDIYTSDRDQLAEKIRLARFVVTCTGYNKAYLEKLAPLKKSAIHRIYHGIDTSLFGNHSATAVPGPPYRLLTIARLTQKKGLPTVYRALKQLMEEGIDFRHTLIGDGDDRAQILRLVAELGLSERCRWLGTLPHETVLQHYRAADLFVLGCEISDNGDRDGIPNVLMESMAMGVPVVATTVSAIPELVENRVTGLLAAPRSPGALARAMLTMLTDSDLRRTVTRSGKRKIQQEFDNRRLIGNLSRLVQSALDQAPDTSIRQ